MKKLLILVSLLITTVSFAGHHEEEKLSPNIAVSKSNRFMSWLPLLIT